ncbi:MAG TPA: hypothetical protein VN778_04230 [Verrucomicrobiae bacterium]|nr:hypothetical protein [Verrucomicrobiae bacterium]
MREPQGPHEHAVDLDCHDDGLAGVNTGGVVGDARDLHGQRAVASYDVRVDGRRCAAAEVPRKAVADRDTTPVYVLWGVFSPRHTAAERAQQCRPLATNR